MNTCFRMNDENMLWPRVKMHVRCAFQMHPLFYQRKKTCRFYDTFNLESIRKSLLVEQVKDKTSIT